MSAHSSREPPATEAVDDLSLTKEQIAFAKVLGPALARRWRAQQGERHVTNSISSPPPTNGHTSSDAG